MAQDAMRYVGENHTVGLGSGRAATALVSELGKVASKLRVRGVPTSLQIRLVAEGLGIPMSYPVRCRALMWPLTGPTR